MSKNDDIRRELGYGDESAEIPGGEQFIMIRTGIYAPAPSNRVHTMWDHIMILDDNENGL